MPDLNLVNLKQYLILHGQVTLTDLAHHFRHEPDVVEAMLQHWIRKQKVEYVEIKACKKGCCHGGDLNIYRWIATDTKANKNSIPITPICH